MVWPGVPGFETHGEGMFAYVAYKLTVHIAPSVPVSHSKAGLALPPVLYLCLEKPTHVT